MKRPATTRNSPRVPTMRGMTRPRRSAHRPPRRRRRPPADRGPPAPSWATSCSSPTSRPAVPATDAKATAALLADAFGDIGLDRSPAAIRVDVDRPQLPRRDRPAARPAGPRRHPDRRLRRQGRPDRRAPAARPQRLHARARRLRRPRRRRRRCSRSARSSRSTSGERDDATLAAIVAAPQACTARCSSPPASTSAEDFDRCRALGFTSSRATSSPSRASSATAASAPRRLLAARARRAGQRRPLLRRPRADHHLRHRPVAQAAALRQLGVLRAAAQHRLRARGADPARHAHRPPLGDGRGDGRAPEAPHELVAIALQRARMCEMLAGSALPEEGATLFTVGIFSVADCAARRADGGRPRVAAVLPRDPGGAAAPRGPEGRAALGRRSPTSAASSRAPRHRRPARLARRRLPRRARVGRRRPPRGRGLSVSPDRPPRRGAPAARTAGRPAAGRGSPRRSRRAARPSAARPGPRSTIERGSHCGPNFG